MSTATERDYVLGTNEEEIARLGLQHRVWRPLTLDAWQRAGITEGWNVLDVGAGPGFATVDLAEIVGPKGKVLAIERSENFCVYNENAAQIRGLKNVEIKRADLVDDEIPQLGFDAAWSRWVLSFVSDPALVIQKVAKVLRPGGMFVLHEYLDYCSWRSIPRGPLLEQFILDAMQAWRDAGGEPDIGLVLPEMLRSAGFKIIKAEPILFTMRPLDYSWRWPAAFVSSNSHRLEELGKMTSEEAQALRDEFKKMEADPETIMLSPIVFEIFAVKQ